MHEAESYAHLWKLVKEIRFAMLTTVDSTGRLSSRPMTTVQKEFTGELWFFTSLQSTPAVDIASNAAVGVQYCDPGKDVYISISGDAHIERDRVKMESLWSPMVKAWFPKGIDDPDLGLLCVDAHEAEYWDVKESKVVQLFKIAKAIASGKRPDDLGEHRKMAL